MRDNGAEVARTLNRQRVQFAAISLQLQPYSAQQQRIANAAFATERVRLGDALQHEIRRRVVTRCWQYPLLLKQQWWRLSMCRSIAHIPLPDEPSRARKAITYAVLTCLDGMRPTVHVALQRWRRFPTPDFPGRINLVMYLSQFFALQRVEVSLLAAGGRLLSRPRR